MSWPHGHIRENLRILTASLLSKSSSGRRDYSRGTNQPRPRMLAVLQQWAELRARTHRSSNKRDRERISGVSVSVCVWLAMISWRQCLCGLDLTSSHKHRRRRLLLKYPIQELAPQFCVPNNQHYLCRFAAATAVDGQDDLLAQTTSRLILSSHEKVVAG